MKTIWKKYQSFFLILIVTFLLRLPSLFEPFIYGDEGIYLTLGLAIRRGLLLYKEIHDNKPPLLYLLAALTGNFSLYRALLFFWSGVTIFVFYRLSQLLFKNKKAQVLTTFLFALLSSIHTFEGNVGNAENFMLLPILGGFYFYLQGKNRKNYFLSGLLFALTALFKIPAVFDFGAVILLIFLAFLELKKKKVSFLYSSFPFLIAGFFLPFLITFLYFGIRGALKDYLTAAFLQNIPYLSSWAPDKATKIIVSSGFFYSFVNRGLIFLLFLGLIFYFRKKFSLSSKLILCWFAFSLFAALLSTRPYPHYLLQVIPPLSLSLGLIFSKTKEKLIPLILFFVFISSFLYFKFWHYPNISYYQNFYRFALGLKSRENYFTDFDKDALALYQTAEYLKTRTAREEKIFIWGNQPSIYALTCRLPVGRYTVAYHIVDFNGYEETMEALTKNPPRYLIVSSDEKRPFPSFFVFLQENYLLAAQFGNFRIFRRLL